MAHDHVTELLTAYCHGELGAEESCRVARHLRVCASCRVEFDEARFAVHCGEHLTRVEAPAGLWQQIEAALDDPRQAARVSGWRESRWWSWLESSPWWSTVAAACATLVLGIFLGMRWMRPPQPLAPSPDSSRFAHAGDTPVYMDLAAYLGPIQAAPRAESYDAVVSAPPQFQACQKTTLLSLGLTHVLELSPLEGFTLASTRIQNYQDREVVQLVYSGAGEAFSVFVGPRDVEFRFGQESAYDTMVGGIKTRELDCPYQKSYAFSGPQRKYVVVSKSLDQERALSVMQFFLNFDTAERASR
jgi:hypothetical protein